MMNGGKASLGVVSAMDDDDLDDTIDKGDIVLKPVAETANESATPRLSQELVRPGTPKTTPHL